MPWAAELKWIYVKPHTAAVVLLNIALQNVEFRYNHHPNSINLYLAQCRGSDIYIISTLSQFCADTRLLCYSAHSDLGWALDIMLAPCTFYTRHERSCCVVWDGLQQIDIFHILCSPRDPNCPRISNILRSQRSSKVSSCSLALFVMTELCHDTNMRGEMMKWRSTKLFRYIYFWRVMKRWEEALMEAWMEQSLWSHCFDFSWEVLRELGYCFIKHISSRWYENI